MKLYRHQQLAVEKIKTGSILVGGVGSGKSITSLYYFFVKVCKGRIGEGIFESPKEPRDLYIITTARKRDTHEWDLEMVPFCLCDIQEMSVANIKVVVDSWNNIKKYQDVKNAFFIFDEQRVVGSGAWVKSFIKISRSNDWILLSATPGDTWSDYIPVFIANGFYKNRTQFLTQHAVFKPFMNYPVIDHYVDTKILEKYRNDILVPMDFERETIKHELYELVSWDKDMYRDILKTRWNPWKEEPISDAAGLSQCLRRVVNSDKTRLDKVLSIVKEKKKVIIFYNFNYELDLLMSLFDFERILYSQWNGHKHEKIPEGDKWVYLVQYAAGAEGWNCITTDTVIFYSQNHSYKMMTQAAGRIDRLNTPYKDLYFYHIRSNAYIDLSITRCLENKENFNENAFDEKF